MKKCKRSRSPLSPPFVKDYRPYTGRQLIQRPSIVEDLEHNIHKSSWDLFYRNNTINGFKDRNYILREFVELREAIMGPSSVEQAATCEDVELHSFSEATSPLDSCGMTNLKPFSWMEAGCGVGNAMLPIFKQFGHLSHWRSLIGFDISKVAIKLLNEKKASLPQPLQEKLHVFVCNPCEQRVAECIYPSHSSTTNAYLSTGSSSSLCNSSVNFVSMIFVLSSIPVSLHTTVVGRIAESMDCPGGIFFFRDYARSDLAEKRFQSRKKGDIDTLMEGRNYMDDKFGERKEFSNFARTNGTLSHFFTKEELDKLFTSIGFSVIEIREVNREVTNRKAAVCLSRKFIQGRFRLERVDI